MKYSSKTTRVTLTIPSEIYQKLRKAAPKGTRSSYVAQVLEKSLTEEERKKLRENLIKGYRDPQNKKIIAEIMEDYKYVDAEAEKFLPPWED